jgi:hypothetical protein
MNGCFVAILTRDVSLVVFVLNETLKIRNVFKRDARNEKKPHDDGRTSAVLQRTHLTNSNENLADDNSLMIRKRSNRKNSDSGIARKKLSRQSAQMTGNLLSEKTLEEQIMKLEKNSLDLANSRGTQLVPISLSEKPFDGSVDLIGKIRALSKDAAAHRSSNPNDERAVLSDFKLNK